MELESAVMVLPVHAGLIELTIEQKALLIPLAVTLLVTLLVCWRYAVRNPVKQFRPPFGRVVLAGVAMLGLGTVVSVVVASMMVGSENLARSLDPEIEMDSGRRAGGASAEGGGEGWQGMGERGGDERQSGHSFFEIPFFGGKLGGEDKGSSGD